MRAIAPFLALALAASTTATAAALLGTKDSFASSPFCKSYACKLAGKDVLGPGLSEWRYTIRGEFEPDMQTAPVVVSVIRQRDIMISGQFVTGAQDSVLFPDRYNTKMVASFVGALTGKAPTGENLHSLNNGCGASSGQVKTVVWKAGSKEYRMSCLLTGEFANAYRFSFHVHLP